MPKDNVEQTKTPVAIKRIGEQVSALIMPNLRPLSKVLQDQINGTEKQRNQIARQIEQTRSEAMAAATQLKLWENNYWQQNPITHMSRVKQLRGNTDG